MIKSQTTTLVSIELLLKLIFSLSPFILSTILNIRDSLPPLLSESTINIVTDPDPDLIEFPTPDAILTPSPIPTLLMSLTNDVNHSVALLELGVKFNALFLSPVDELV